VYIAELSNGTTKVGKTGNPRERLSTHNEQAAPHGAEIVRLWLSVPHQNPADNERALVSFARKRCSGSVRQEYFLGLTFQTLVDVASALTWVSVDLGEIASRDVIEPPFGQVSVEDRDLVDIARERIAGLFGRRRDGTYTMTMANTTGDPQEFRTEVEAMARVRGCSVAEVLSMTRLQVMEEMLTSIVRTEALELKAYALRTGHLEVLETMGDLLDEADLRGRETKQ
jgi:hypothetical protein